jgi:hypothetical protein
MSNSASSYVDPINTEYREVVKAERAALPHAIKCGELLNLAKENVKAEKMKWGEWLKVNCPEIAQETASLYMRLAEHRAKVSEAKSIREARELLPKAQPRGTPPTPKEPQPSSGFEPKADNSPTFEEELEVRAADELFPVLVEQWDDDELERLFKLIGDHLQQKRTAVAPRPPISNAVTNSPPPSSVVRRV